LVQRGGQTEASPRPTFFVLIGKKFVAETAYRRDIDGLRAVAVSAVIAYHLSADSLPGGYLGVDIFFVLSGFLITTIIWNDLETDRFSIRRFYERRVRRIMPALIAVLIPTSVLAIVILLPADLIGFARSLLATIVFLPNVYFWRDTNYFARAAEEKPLLHLWSLGVEEQFYLLFPLLLLVIARLWRKQALVLVGALTLASLAVNIALNKFDAANSAFFLLPPRAWELGAGALLALAPAHALPRGAPASLMSMIGLVLVAYALVSPLPLPLSLPAALPAVIGTGLLLWAGMAGLTPVGRGLSHAVPVWLGKISYSLYLWHWPIIVFATYYLVRELNLWEMAAAICLMLVLSDLSWRYIEQPARKRMAFGRVATASVASSVCAAVLAVIILQTGGLPSRLPADAADINAAIGTNYRCPITSYISFGGSRACALNLPSRDPNDAAVVLFGNSHAQMYAPLVEDIAREQGETLLLVPMNACLPTVSVNIDLPCLQLARRNLEDILRLPRATTVVIGLTWELPRSGLVDAEGNRSEKNALPMLVAGLDNLIARIEATGRQVVLIGPIAIPGFDVASYLSRQRAFGRPAAYPETTPSAAFEQQYDAAVAHFEVRLGERLVRPDKALCDATSCFFVRDGKSLFADSSHLAIAELPRFRNLFEPALKHIESRSGDIR
jgi:peptidoglycan/LPS O-acetylase OafA/YrhL